MREVAVLMDWRFSVALVLAHETGHRIGAISALRWSDVDVEGGRIRWRKQNDKLGREHETELTARAISALREARSQDPGVGDRWVLPAPGNGAKPVSRHRLRSWWLQAERRAELEHVDRMGWHSLRRKFATELKDVPLTDLAELGGWKTTETLVGCYQRPDRDTQRAALANRRHIGVESTQRIDTNRVEGTGSEESRSA
jgi:integrase